MLLKQQNASADGLDLSSLTLKDKEPSSPVEEVVTNISSAKVSRKAPIYTLCLRYCPRSDYFTCTFFPVIVISPSILYVIRSYMCCHICLFSFLACIAVLISIWWWGGGAYRRCSFWAVRLSWSTSGERAGGTSCSRDGWNPRASAWWGEADQSGRVRPPVNQFGAWTLLLFLPRWVDLVSQQIAHLMKLLLKMPTSRLHPLLADDCQQMFLHPVNVRCLLREYGSLEASPDSITATVVEIVGHTVTEVSRQGTTKSRIHAWNVLFIIVFSLTLCYCFLLISLVWTHRRTFVVGIAIWLICRSHASSASVSWLYSHQSCPKKLWTHLQVSTP